MKKFQMKSTLEAMKKVRIHKFEDKDTKNTFIENHFHLLGQQKKYEEAIESLRTAHLGPYESELQEVNELQAELQKETEAAKRQEIVDKINSKTELLDAINGFNKAVNDLGNEEVEIAYIDAKKFQEDYMKQEYDLEVVEALFPMFTN